MDSGERGTQQPGSLQLVPQFVVLIIRGWLGHWDLRISELEDTMMCGIIRYHLYYLSGCRKSDVQVRHLPHFSCAPEILDPLKASERHQWVFKHYPKHAACCFLGEVCGETQVSSRMPLLSSALVPWSFTSLFKTRGGQVAEYPFLVRALCPLPQA